MVKHIGIVGVSAEGASLCYTTICEIGFEKLGKYHHPELSTHTLPLIEYMTCLEKDDWDAIGTLMLTSIKKLASIGAQVVICPDNTVHYAYPLIVNKSPIPFISIIETVAQECKDRGYKNVGILGTKYTMQGSLYKDALSKHSIGYMVPTETDQQIVNSVIFDELVPGKISKNSSKPLLKVIDNLKEAGCDSIILGCTELPIVVDQSDSRLPLIDSTRLLARKAIEYACNL